MCAQNSLNLQLSKKGFKIGQLNIQGIQNKFDEVDTTHVFAIENVQCTFDDIVVLVTRNTFENCFCISIVANTVGLECENIVVEKGQCNQKLAHIL